MVYNSARDFDLSRTKFFVNQYLINIRLMYDNIVIVHTYIPI